jgi:predicted aconitase with swiveling domain
MTLTVSKVYFRVPSTNFMVKAMMVTAWMLKEMVSRGVAPKALILNFSNPIIAQGAAFANLSMIDRFEVDITKCVRNGAEVQVTPETGELRIL